MTSKRFEISAQPPIPFFFSTLEYSFSSFFSFPLFPTEEGYILIVSSKYNTSGSSPPLGIPLNLLPQKTHFPLSAQINRYSPFLTLHCVFSSLFQHIHALQLLNHLQQTFFWEEGNKIIKQFLIISHISSIPSTSSNYEITFLNHLKPISIFKSSPKLISVHFSTHLRIETHHSNSVKVSFSRTDRKTQEVLLPYPIFAPYSGVTDKAKNNIKHRFTPTKLWLVTMTHPVSHLPKKCL